MEKSTKRRRGERWNESEVRPSFKPLPERPSSPYRISEPGHDDFVYSDRPEQPDGGPRGTDEAEVQVPRKKRRRQDRTLAGLGGPDDE